MGIFKDEAWQGVTGNLSMYTRKGKKILRTLPKQKKKISPAFAVAQGHFAYVGNLVRKMKEATDIGFSYFDEKRSPYNVAISINLNKYKIARQLDKTNDLMWFEISKGDLSNAGTISAAINPDGFIDISWEGTEDWKAHYSNDSFIAVVYNVTKDAADIHFSSATRKDQSARLQWTNYKSGDVLELFVFFHTHNLNFQKESKANVSDSRWVGQFTI